MRSGSLTISEDISYSLMDRNVYLYKHRTKIRIATIVFLITVALIALFTYILNRRNVNEIDDKITMEKLTSLEEQCRVLSSRRFDCFPRGNPSQDLCTKRGCCWHTDDNQSDVPKCFYPVQYNSYKYINVTEHDNGITAFMKLNISSPYPDNIELVQLEVKYLSEYQLNVKIFDPTTKRYEPLYPKLNLRSDDKRLKKLRYIVKINQDKLGFQVIRTENNTVIFDSEDVGGFIFANQFLQLSALLPSKYIYGLGHQRNKFLLNMDWKTITLFNHDLPPTDEVYIKTDKPNFYSSHPFYLVMEEDSLSHGVLLLNSNAMDIILQPAPAITFRTIGGIIDLYFFLGPSPSKVINQYTELVGRPYMPPYWSLGFHLSRLGYGTVNVTREVLDNNRLMGIPVDTQWNDLDYMDKRNDFTFDKNTFGDIKNFVEYLHHEEMHYVILVDPGISAGEPSGSYPPYDDGISKNVFIMDAKNEKPFMCRVWNRSNKTVFPDFTNPNTDEYWQNQIEEQYSKQFKFDGIWLDMNEPTNFINGSFDGCPNTVYDFPPYLPRVDGDLLSYHTLCMSARHHGGLHYDIHNVYGISQTASTTGALEHITNKRAFVLTRATFPGSGRYSGTWTGDVSSTWDDMRYSVADILSFSLFGIPLVGADICGFNYNTTVPLCQRWSELGAFYPFSRNHNSDDTVVQDPFTLGHDVIASAKKALSIRYSLLPYLYTLFWQATTTGSTVARPVFFEFAEDKQTYSQYQQFFWGSALLILPVLFENETSVTAYLPKGIWFDYYTKQMIKSNGEYQLISAPLDTIPLLYRGGNIIPTQEHSSTVAASRRNKMGLTVVPNEMNYATGTLFWDDGESLNTYENKLYNLVKFKLSGNSLESNVIWWGNIEQQPLGTITIIGVNEIIKTVKINDKKTNVNFVYDGSIKTLWIEDLSLTLKEPFVITWTSAE